MTQRELALVMLSGILHDDRTFRDGVSKHRLAQECGVSERMVYRAAADIRKALPAKMWKDAL